MDWCRLPWLRLQLSRVSGRETPRRRDDGVDARWLGAECAQRPAHHEGHGSLRIHGEDPTRRTLDERPVRPPDGGSGERELVRITFRVGRSEDAGPSYYRDVAELLDDTQAGIRREE